MMILPNIIPCKDCPKKGCGAYHDKCEKYAEYKRKISIVNNRKYRDSEIVNYFINSRGRQK